MAEAVITGGLGFVGRRLTDKLLQKGYTVKIFSRSNPSARENPAVEVIKADYSNIDALAREMEGADVIFHLAAAIFAFNKEEFERANVGVSENLARAAVKAGIKNFIYLSSQAAAGASEYKDNPRSELDVPSPISDYGLTKLAAENIINELPAHIHRVILRAPIVYGKNDSGVSKIAAWVNRGIMVNTSSSDMFFNFVYIDDLVEALYIAANTAQANAQTFFVCENKSYSWKYFINSMADAMSRPRPLMFNMPYFVLEIAAFIYEIAARIFGFAPALNYDKIKEAHIKGHWVCNSQKWISLTGQKFTSLKEGLKNSF
ncbi:MAG: NAD-dependent epimerase/dehydratase family protein [Elusimicrobiota bacterium]|jgi:nucleoside-diphosphate-sugar epimerase|nr:NAD-dependent epimerase/dehydratase family protein [Elusimicrobiota bacterium]